MKFRTEIPITPSEFEISHQNKILMMGSCFVENISAKLIDGGFNVDVNPFGIAYNPISVLQNLRDLIHKKEYTSNDIFLNQGVYNSFSHHSRFSHPDSEMVIQNVNLSIKHSSQFLKEADYLYVTFGTSYAYYLQSTGKVVANCHKLPANTFFRKRLTPQEIVQDWNVFVREIKDINPVLKIIFTISPIRHWKDGAYENQVSKSVLFLAVDELIKENENVYYFPSYELVMDDLRDYRFYSEDMLHPNSQAIQYIWEKFSEIYFSKDTLSLAKEWDNIQQAFKHRPFNSESEEYKKFLQNAEIRKREFLKKNKWITEHK